MAVQVMRLLPKGDCCPFAPPSVLLDISPQRGEIGCCSGLDSFATLVPDEKADVVGSPRSTVGEIKAAVRSPPLRGRCPAGQRGARKNDDRRNPTFAAKSSTERELG